MRGSTTLTVIKVEKKVRNTTETAEKYQFMEGLREMSGIKSFAAPSVYPMLTTSIDVIIRLEANAPDTEA